MLVRLTMGAYAGEVRELTFEAARALVENGQAEDVFEQLLNAPRARADRVENAAVLASDVTHVTHVTNVTNVTNRPAEPLLADTATPSKLLKPFRKKR